MCYHCIVTAPAYSDQMHSPASDLNIVCLCNSIPKDVASREVTCLQTMQTRGRLAGTADLSETVNFRRITRTQHHQKANNITHTSYQVTYALSVLCICVQEQLANNS